MGDDGVEQIFHFLTGPVNELAWLYCFLPGVVVSGSLLTVKCGFVQFRRFAPALRKALGMLGRKGEAGPGELSPAQALSTALAGTLGTGNIVGTCQALALGGCGAVFWLWAAAVLAMAIKYFEVALAVKYRKRDETGDRVGGPMYYITGGLGESWRPLATAYALFALLASFGIGNMSQVNSIALALDGALESFHPLGENCKAVLRWALGLSLAGAVGAVLLGGLRGIGRAAERLVPAMSLMYILSCLAVLICHAQKLPACLGRILAAAFAPEAVLGAASGITVREAVLWGLRRSAFSNEAGLGSAAMAHAAARAKSPADQGLLGILEVFLDTIVLCTLTALTVLCSGAEPAPGPEPVAAALSTVFGPKAGALLVALALGLFAFSTLLAWSLYGARCAQYLLGGGSIVPYRLLFLLAIVLGSVWPMELVWGLADTFNGLMAVPNLIALIALAPKARDLSRDGAD